MDTSLVTGSVMDTSLVTEHLVELRQCPKGKSNPSQCQHARAASPDTKPLSANARDMMPALRCRDVRVFQHLTRREGVEVE